MSAATKTKPATGRKLAAKPPKLQLVPAPTSQDNEKLRALIVMPVVLGAQALSLTEELIEHLVKKHMVDDEFKGEREDLIACFSKAPDLVPLTLSDCVYAHRTLGEISMARADQPACSITTRGAAVCEAARRFIEHCMGHITPRSEAEARELFDYYVGEFDNPFSCDVDERVFMNLIFSPYRGNSAAVVKAKAERPEIATPAAAAPMPAPAMAPSALSPPGWSIDLVIRTTSALNGITAMIKAVRMMMVTPGRGGSADLETIDTLLEEIWIRAEVAADDVSTIAYDAGIPLETYSDDARINALYDNHASRLSPGLPQ